MVKKLDLRRELKHLYQPSKSEVELVRIPKFNYLMIDGEGDPNNSQRFSDAVQALYALAYTLKFMVRKEKGIDYPVMPLEGLWWMDDMTQFNMENKALWKWTLLILQPSFVTKSLFVKAVRQAVAKKGFPAISGVRMEPFAEGLAVQITHVGPYSDELPAIQKLHASAKDRGCDLRGRHHEIYLGDPRKTKPEKLRTVIRQPIQKIRTAF